MPDFYELCVVLLAAIGAVCMIWAILGLILRPRKAFRLTALVRASGAEELTEAILGCGWARQWLSGGFDMLIVTDGMEPDALRMASLYAANSDGATLMSIDN